MQVKRMPAAWPSFTPLGTTDETVEGIKGVLEGLYTTLRDYRTSIKRTLDDMAVHNDVTEGTTAPSSTPSRVGLLFLNTTAKDMYISVGTASSADWKKITP